MSDWPHVERRQREERRLAIADMQRVVLAGSFVPVCFLLGSLAWKPQFFLSSVNMGEAFGMTFIVGFVAILLQVWVSHHLEAADAVLLLIGACMNLFGSYSTVDSFIHQAQYNQNSARVVILFFLIDMLTILFLVRRFKIPYWIKTLLFLEQFLLNVLPSGIVLYLLQLIS